MRLLRAQVAAPAVCRRTQSSYARTLKRTLHNETFDVAIIGGGVMGSSTAFHLKKQDNDLKICVIEKDSTYTTASTSLSVGSLRLQFSNKENIELSKRSREFIRNITEHLSTDGDAVDVGWIPGRYLFLATSAGMPTLRENIDLQNKLGAQTVLMEGSAAIAAKYPFMQTDDLVGAGLGGPYEGWLDPYSLMQAFRKKATQLGVAYINGTVDGVVVDSESHKLISLKVQSGSGSSLSEIKCGKVVNAAGPSSAAVIDMFMPPDEYRLPVRPRKRSVFKFSCQSKVKPADPDESVPMVIDTTGVYFRPEGDGYLGGVAPSPDNDPDAYNDFEVDWSLWNDVVWPSIARRVPAFEAVKVVGAWAGHYEYNTADHNGIVGRHPLYHNLYVITGFSGHGLQQSPAAGEALAELIVHGKYSNIDLTKFGLERFLLGGSLVPEKNII